MIKSVIYFHKKFFDNHEKVVAKGKLAAYLIEDAEIRQSLMNDIAELDAFCHGRQRTFFRFSNN